MHVVQEEEFAQAANAEFEETRRKHAVCEQKLATLGSNQAMTEQNAQLNDEIQQLEQRLANEKQQMNGEKQKYRQTNEQSAEIERKKKRIDARILKTRETIRILEENIQSELNRYKSI